MKLNRPKFKNYKPGEFPEATVFDVCELKYDGWWGQLLMEGDRWQIFSRTGQLKKEGKLVKPVERTLLHGEYCYGTEWSKDHPEYYDQLAVYGAEMVNGQDLRQVENAWQRKILTNFVPRLNATEGIQSGVFLVEQYPMDKVSEVWEANVEFEGLVFKHSRAVWGDAFGRMKRDAQMDYVCLGFESSDSDRHAGWGVASIIGGLIYPGNKGPTEACKVSGLNDVDRSLFYKHPERFVGKVFTAEGKKITKKGALRHPNFLRWRPDKTAAECIWSA